MTTQTTHPTTILRCPSCGAVDNFEILWKEIRSLSRLTVNAEGEVVPDDGMGEFIEVVEDNQGKVYTINCQECSEIDVDPVIYHLAPATTYAATCTICGEVGHDQDPLVNFANDPAQPVHESCAQDPDSNQG